MSVHLPTLIRLPRLTGVAGFIPTALPAGGHTGVRSAPLEAPRFAPVHGPSNLSPALPLEPSEEEKQGMAGGEVALRDAALIARAQAGDHAAFETIFSRHQTQIYNYIYRLMGGAEDAYDMTQDTFLKAYLALPKTSDDLRVGAWLYRIATNVCLDELRHRKLVKWQPWEAFISVFHPSQVAKDSPERDCINTENAEEVQLILDRLHPKYRMCLILREYHDLSYDEIAEVLNTTRPAVKSLLFRAREEFRQVYAKVERQPGRAAAV
jgi:RNA polymerase sigma-70 factor (ECF subfamily)